MKISLTILLLSFFLFPQVGFAQWEEAFPAENLQSYFVQDKLVMVVSVGAKDAVSEVLKGLGKKAISGDALGDVTTLSDEEIVKKAKAQPVQKIIIVRLAGEGADAIAIITIYKKDGTTAGGFTASKETPMTKSSGHSGVSQDEMKAVKEVVPKVTDQKIARRRFLDNYVGFVDWVGINQSGSVVAKWSAPFKGRDRIPLEGADFYDEIGQKKLAEDYRSTQTTKTYVAIGSGIVMAAGLIVMIAPLTQDSSATAIPRRSEFATTKEYNDAVKESLETNDTLIPILIGGGISLIGGIVFTLATSWDSNPVKPEEARRLTRLHNEKLAKDLGIDIDSIQRSEIHAPPTTKDLRIGISPNLNGASVNVGFRF